MQWPAEFLDSIKDTKGFSESAFRQIHQAGEQVTSIRINPYKPADGFADKIPVPWSSAGFYLQERPSFTFDPLFHAGCYYVQEASSMFLEQALQQTTDLSKPLKVLDLCAAPGGKSTHLLSLLSKESLLVSNEVIRSRANILLDNMVKWGCSNVLVSQNDPAGFRVLENYFDLIVVDAPCSGSGLFRRDPSALEQWSLNTVELCSQRQQRILADVLPALKPGGVLIYSTCSYSGKEDEEISDWLIRDMGLAFLQLQTDPAWQVVESDPGYRFWPDKLQGEGFFLACFRKADGDDPVQMKKTGKKNKAKIPELISTLINRNDISIMQFGKISHAVPEILAGDIDFLMAKLRTVYAGTAIGEIIRDKLVPTHALSQSLLVSSAIQHVELDKDDAISFLKRKEFHPGTEKKGWHLVRYKNHNLGWINILPNRINNYYPQMLRILKD